MHEFTLRKKLATAGAAAWGILVLNIIYFMKGAVEYWHFGVVVLLAIELGCWIGAPSATKQAHMDAWREMKEGLTSNEAKENYDFLFTVFCVIVGIGGGFFLGYQTGSFIESLFPQSWIKIGLLGALLILGSVITAGVCTMFLCYETTVREFIGDWAYTGGYRNEYTPKPAFLCISLVAFGAIAPFGAVLLWTAAILGLIALVIILAIGVIAVVYKLAGDSETGAIAFGVVIGITVGAALGWTDLEFTRTSLHMAVGGFSGATFGWALNRISVRFPVELT